MPIGLLHRKANDWVAAMALTRSARALFPLDPVRLDLALFGIGAYSVALDTKFVVDSASVEAGRASKAP